MSSMKLPSAQSVLLELRPSGILHVTLNTPKTYNSFDDQRYQDLIDALNYAEHSKDVKAMVLSATGKFFSSGAALSEGRMTAAKDTGVDARMAKRYVDVLIDFPKLLVAVIHGPAYGITVTTLPFFDLIYASPQATFTTPFSTLGICLEGCSSVTFPPLLGQALTSRLLYMADTITVEEIDKTGLIAGILPAEGMQQAVLEQLEKQLEGLASASILASKSLVKTEEMKKMLHDVNLREMKVLAECVKSDAHREALTRFQEKRKAKKAAKL